MDKKLSDLPIKNTPDGTEFIHILDVNDLSDSPQGTDKRTPIQLSSTKQNAHQPVAVLPATGVINTTYILPDGSQWYWDGVEFIKYNKLNYVTPQEYGAVGDGVTDDTTALTNAINSGMPVSLGGKYLNYLVTATLNVPANSYIYGNGAILKTSLNIGILSLQNNAKIEGVIFEGDGISTNKKNQIGIFIDGGATFTNVSRTIVDKCSFNNLAGSGYLVKRVVNNHEGNILSNSIFKSCKIGVNIEERGEYTIVNSCSFSLCDTAVSIRGGNSLVTSCVISDNITYGILVLNGENDAHGTVSNCLVKHNDNFAVRVENINVKDFTFQSCEFTLGKVWLYKCEGVVFNNCVFYFLEGIYEEGAINCYVKNYRFVGNINVFANHNLDISQVFYSNGSLDQIVNMVSVKRLEKGYSEMNFTNPANLTVPNGDGFIFNFDTTIFNAISNNISYQLHNFWNFTDKCWDFNILKTNTSNHFAELMIQLAIGKPDNSIANPIDTVDVYLFDLTTNKRLASFTTSASQGIYRLHSFTGSVVKGKIQIRIDNKTGSNILIYRHQGVAIPSYGIATGF